MRGKFPLLAKLRPMTPRERELLIKRIHDRAAVLGAPVQTLLIGKGHERSKNLVRDFARGQSQSLTLASLEKIADALEWTLAQLLGSEEVRVASSIELSRMRAALYLADQAIGAHAPGCPLRERREFLAELLVEAYRYASIIARSNPEELDLESEPMREALEQLRDSIAENDKLTS